MAGIEIKCRPNTKERKWKLIEILCSRDVEISRIITANDGFAVITVNEQNADYIFKAEVKQRLALHDFLPIMPPELKAQKSVIIPRADELLYEWNIVETGEQLLRKNTWIGEELENVYKFPNSLTIKLTFTQTKLAKKCTETGLKAFSISIPPHEIMLEKYIPIKCCMGCYSLEDHFTSECPKGRDYRVCCECSTEGHVWHQCTKEQKKCLNCGENHSTLIAMKCIKGKRYLKRKDHK